MSKFGRRGVGNEVGGYRQPEAPTPFAPGSDEKISVLEQRAAAGEALFHPDDAAISHGPMSVEQPPPRAMFKVHLDGDRKLVA